MGEREEGKSHTPSGEETGLSMDNVQIYQC